MKYWVLAFAFLVMPLAVQADALPAAPYVQVNGHGSLTVVPDMARITVTVAQTAKDLSQARNDVESRASKVIATARKLGIAERDINAANISIWPEYQWQNNSQVFMGQNVSRRILITQRDLSRYADLIGALTKAGVANFDTTLDHSDLPSLRRQALAKAVEDAHARALALTTAAGMSLGAVYSISENSGSPRPIMAGGLQAATVERSNGAKYEPGTMEISADVSVVYLLKGGH